MKEIPVLFNGAMVRAILDDRKTQTRRPLPAVFNSPPSLVHGWLPPGWRLFGQEVPDHWGAQWYGTYPSMVRSPLGKPGDRLWVRETIKRHEHVDGPWHLLPEDRIDSAYYAADHKVTALDYWPWKRPVLPAIHCPRGLSRLFLDVLDVRIERLCDISEEDALAEGVAEQMGGRYRVTGHDFVHNSARGCFNTLWNIIYGAGAFETNPWVWVTTFRKVP